MKKINKIAIASTTVALTSAIVGGCVAANIPTNVYGPPPSAEVNQSLPFDEEKTAMKKMCVMMLATHHKHRRLSMSLRRSNLNSIN